MTNDWTLLAKEKAAVFCDGGKRQWLLREVKSYGDDTQAITMHVLEGSPPRAIILDLVSMRRAVLLNAEGASVGYAFYDFATDKIKWKTTRRAR